MRADVNYFALTTDRLGGPRARAGRRTTLAATIGLAVLAAILAAGFGGYLNPSLLVSLENLRLCF